MSDQSDSEKRLGWHWLWFAPLCAMVLFFVEGHTAPNAFRLLKLGYQRWSWGGLISPSTFFCLSMIAASVCFPVQWLVIAAGLIMECRDIPRRRIYITLIVAAIFVLPFVTDFLIWGSFPFNIDNNRISRLRMIPFIPWPDGHFGEY